MKNYAGVFLVLVLLPLQCTISFILMDKTTTATARRTFSEEVGVLLYSQKENDNSDSHSINQLRSRRNLFSTLVSTSSLSLSLSLGALSLLPSNANAADDRLFKPNPLTNPLLEKIRILEQAEADTIQYKGELAPGSPKGRDSYAKLLIPILDIQADFEKVDKLIHATDGSGLKDASIILKKPQLEKIAFKKTYNAFADNIYYSDPDRANAYLGGGAIPKNEQSIAYLLRNDILTNLENLQAEVEYLLKEMDSGNPLETEDLFSYSKIIMSGMEQYIELVPPGEVKLAKEFIVTR
mmetsp:Transcript_17075/g.20850  ORF Transcript_17075/g.20850 Transcript_17075/m.20850 type:complete len:295 (-) Transcript_17075:874-1758(-)